MKSFINNTLYFKLLALTILLSSCATKRSFNLVLLPDTQNYSQKFPEIFEKQTKWIAERSNEITFVLHLGDITNNNNKEQWENASKAMNILEGKVPYAVVTGNHDIGKNGRTDVRDTDLFNQYFSYGKHSKMNGFKGAYEEGKMDNTWHEFKAGGHKWLDFITGIRPA